MTKTEKLPTPGDIAFGWFWAFSAAFLANYLVTSAALSLSTPGTEPLDIWGSAILFIAAASLILSGLLAVRTRRLASTAAHRGHPVGSIRFVGTLLGALALGVSAVLLFVQSLATWGDPVAGYSYPSLVMAGRAAAIWGPTLLLLFVAVVCASLLMGASGRQSRNREVFEGAISVFLILISLMPLASAALVLVAAPWAVG